jgi:hypothetical protein
MKGNTQPPQAPSLDRFMEQLAKIAPPSEEPISPESHLINDLKFDSSTFSLLGLLLYERYGVGGLSTASLPEEEELTVEAFFRRCVLDVLGIRPPDR